MKKLILTLVSCLILACSSKEPAAPTKTVEAAPEIGRASCRERV